MQEPSFKPLEKSTQKLIKMMFFMVNNFCLFAINSHIQTKYSLQLNKMLHVDYVNYEDEKDAVLPFKLIN